MVRRVYIEIDFSNRAEISALKKLGGAWDFHKNKYYVHSDIMRTEEFTKWLNKSYDRPIRTRSREKKPQMVCKVPEEMRGKFILRKPEFYENLKLNKYKSK